MKKSFYILGLLFLVVLAVLVVIWLNQGNENKQRDLIITPISSDKINPVFMSTSEKSEYNLPKDARVQVLNKSADGTIMSYKIIRSDSDMILDRKDLQIR